MMIYEAITGRVSNCRDEWWHYSYGDAGWAVRLRRANMPLRIGNHWILRCTKNPSGYRLKP